MGRFIYVCIFATYLQMSNRRIICKGDSPEDLKVTVDRAPSGDIQVELETPPDDEPEILHQDDAPEIPEAQINDNATARTSSPEDHFPPALLDFSQYHSSFPNELWHFLNHLMACLSAQAYHEGIFIPDVLLDASQDGDVQSSNESEGASEIGHWHLPLENPTSDEQHIPMDTDIQTAYPHTDNQNQEPQPSTSQCRSPPGAPFPDIPEDIWDLLHK